MATNENVATSLRVLAEAAEDSIVQDDLNSLADTVERHARAFPRTHDELLVAVQEKLGSDVVHESNRSEAPYPVYVCDRARQDFLEAFPNWKLVNDEGEDRHSLWWNYPVRRDE